MPAFKKRSRHDNIFSFATDRIVCVTKNRTASNHVCETKDCTADNLVCEKKTVPQSNLKFLQKFILRTIVPIFFVCKTGSVPLGNLNISSKN